jgi:dCMP deaminase
MVGEGKLISLENLTQDQIFGIIEDASQHLSKISGLNSRPDWDAYFMMTAKLLASRSTCLSRRVGAVIVKENRIISTGYVGACSGMDSCLDNGECFRRSNKLEEGTLDKHENCQSAHAEVNAVAYAARYGVAIGGATIYTTLHPCYTCAKLVVQCGIKEVVYELGYKSGNEKRDKEWEEFMKKNKITVRKYELPKEKLASVLTSLIGTTSDRMLEIAK